MIITYIRIFLIIMLLLNSCKSNMPARFYKSSDEVTGGFYDFSLDLMSNGKLELSIEVSTPIIQSESGVEWQSSSNIIRGKWFIEGKKINYVLDKSISYIDSIFSTKDFVFTNEGKPTIVFSSKFDTAYIYGIPCVATKIISKKRDSERR